MTGTPEGPAVKDDPEVQDTEMREEAAEEGAVEEAPATAKAQEGPEGGEEPATEEAVQPEGVMAADAEDAGAPVPHEGFPWGKVIVWTLVVIGAIWLLSRLFGKKRK